jgi:transcriptional regulator with XRE-family HTH domain
VPKLDLTVALSDRLRPWKAPALSEDDWQMKLTSWAQVQRWRRLPTATVVRLDEREDAEAFQQTVLRLAQHQRKDPLHGYVVLAFASRTLFGKTWVEGLLAKFPEPDRVEISIDAASLASITAAVAAKVRAKRKRLRQDLVPNVDLRGSHGRLAAGRIARLFGLSISALAELLGESRQRLSQNPDGEALQAALGTLERIARVRAVLPDDAAFRSWLRTPVKALQNKAPLDWLQEGRGLEVAEYVEDLLSGTPS